MSKRCKIQKEYYKKYGNYKGKGIYSDQYVKWLEGEIIDLRDCKDVKYDEFCNHKDCRTDSLPHLINWFYCHKCERPFNIN